MANENSYATFLSNGGRIAKILSDLLHVKLYDPTSLRALMQFVPRAGQQSTVTNVTTVTRGAVMAAASSEISGGASNTLLTTGNYDLTIARYLLKMQATDLFKMTGGAMDVSYIIGVLVESLDLTLTDLCCALFANIAGNVGTTTVALSVDDIFDAIYYLNLQNNPGNAAAVLHAKQINHLIESTRGETGVMQFRTDASALLALPGVGWKGRFLEVDFYQSDSVALANANADRRGCMFTGGAFAYQLGSVRDMDPQVDPADIIVGTEEMFVERVRDADNGMTSYIVNSYPATAEQEDLRAVRITTSAT